MKQRMFCKKCNRPLNTMSKLAQCERCVKCNEKLEKALSKNSIEV